MTAGPALINALAIFSVPSSYTAAFAPQPTRVKTFGRNEKSVYFAMASSPLHRQFSPVPSNSLALTVPRGGSGITETASDVGTGVLSAFSKWNSNPQMLFNSSLLGLILLAAAAKLVQSITSQNMTGAQQIQQEQIPESFKSLQLRYLPVFWLMRMAFWMSGPYLFAVYAAKTVNGAPASMGFISRIFLTQFGSIALFGPLVGSASDRYGRKKATLAAAIIYTLGALSTRSPLVWVLFVGRALGGVGTTLLSSAPESWLVSESQNLKDDDPEGKWLRDTFGTAYAIDAVVAICAGQLAGLAASFRGPTGPFEVSPLFLAMGALLATTTWKENVAPKLYSGGDNDSMKVGSSPELRDAFQAMLADKKILLIGAVQSLFEAAMYIFVLQWPQAMAKSVKGFFGESATTPFGTVFSCFMASCLLGSTLFGQLVTWKITTEFSTTMMLAAATASLSVGTYIMNASNPNLAALIAAFLVFEGCVGMYFPSIGTLRSKYLPDTYRSAIMTLFGVPVNILVVSVYLGINQLGSTGAMAVGSAAVGLATFCMAKLNLAKSKV